MKKVLWPGGQNKLAFAESASTETPPYRPLQEISVLIAYVQKPPLTLCLLGNFACFFVICCLVLKSTFSKYSLSLSKIDSSNVS